MKLKLENKELVAKDTKSFYFKPEINVKWLPGQYFYFTIPRLKYPDPRGNTRHFTLSSSPTEGPKLKFTTRMRKESGYKRTLDELKIGTTIEGEGPNGTYILDENEKGTHILIAGGIGITPFRSFIKYTIDKKLTNIKLHLIYANSTPDEITFKKELDLWSKNNKNIKFAMTVSRPGESKEPWRGLRGRIDEIIIKNLITDWKLNSENLTYWLCGPPGMVDAMEKILAKLKITSGMVRSEKFDGY